ncbi:EscU/YscU/HrcU family type III secretion system export apparatus switch protein [Kordiimonas laminariae]|uniref:EscU/YscU/HrcU family type III secretion system export apparatus switch protein n=1 Tax=Kordiimonas laminariae TaxID=2917717 RepID=UPI001FF56BD1|nr:EscU/YscU/HrcU family type III secretion system export apparatus switch protein [Kordiimonas laminariae]MCK0069794.1 EscU/YscU/HrcU family type III secretion system export apparatus switch protein [Kordiimonas laminariae]
MNSENDQEKDLTKVVAVKQHSEALAPVITAKAEGVLADRLLEIAFAKDVKVRQDKDLTELLSALDVDCPVPLEALNTVSIILERVYAENEKMKRQQEQTRQQEGHQKA